MRFAQSALVDRLLAAIETSGGLYGLFLFSRALYEGSLTGGLFGIAVNLMGATYFCLSLGAGLLLVRQRDRGAVLSELVQLVQLVHVQFSGVRIAVLSGVGVTVTQSGWTTGIAGEIGSYFSIAYGGAIHTAFGVNLVAVAFTTYLLSVKRERTSGF